MTSKIALVEAAARRVFSTAGPYTSSQLAPVINAVQDITADDLGFDSRILTSPVLGETQIFYQKILENDVLSMGIFALRSGSKIPLHNHPDMYGIAKCIFGNLRCRSYSKVTNPTGLNPDILTVRVHHNVVANSQFQPCLLTPTEGNYHEMLAEPGGAAFLDILAPPYDYQTGQRVCHYYRELMLSNSLLATIPAGAKGDVPSALQLGGGNDAATKDSHQTNYVGVNSTSMSSHTSSSDTIFLVEIEQPPSFNCDRVKYEGPSLS